MSDLKQHHAIEVIHLMIKQAIYNDLCTGLAYGIFFAVYCVSIRILLSKGALFQSQGHVFLFGITTIIFILSTTGLILSIRLTSQYIPFVIHTLDRSFDNVWSLQKMRIVSGILTAIGKLNPMLSDVVFAWRAVVLWRYDRRVVTIVSICLLGTFAASIYDWNWNIQTSVSPERLKHPSRFDGEITAIFVGPILITNLLLTSLIAWKAWDYHRTVGPDIRKGRRFVRVEKVLGLLIESDIVYCMLWIIYLLTTFGIIPSGGLYLGTVMFYISSTYPVSVNVLAVTTQSYKFSEV